MSEVITIEAAELAYDAHRHEGTLARYAGRRKSACCRLCGSPDGMQKVHRDTLTIMEPAQIAALAPWYSELGNDAEYLFFTCRSCNQDRIVPDTFEALSLADVIYWLNPDPMQPDHTALAAEEPVSQIGGSRDSAGLEEG